MSQKSSLPQAAKSVSQVLVSDSDSIGNWRRVFTEEFAKGVSIEEGKSVSKNVLAVVRATIVGAADFTGDLVEAVMRYGPRVIPAGFDKKPYMEAPRWKWAPANQQIVVVVRSDLHRNKFGTQPVREIRSLEPLPSLYWLHFRASTTTGLPFLKPEYIVMWRITNTDEAAARDNCLRGRFETPGADNRHWERLQYRGVHLVEAFVIRRRDDRIVGKSEAFKVMIE